MKTALIAATSGCLILGWSVAASAQETFEVEIDPVCADRAATEVLWGELSMRLEGLQAAQTDGWRLAWRPEEGLCQLVLKDASVVMIIPLPQGAEEDVLRDAVIRLAWVMTTETPTHPAPPEVDPSKDAPKEAASEATVEKTLTVPQGMLDRSFAAFDTRMVLTSAEPIMAVGARVGLVMRPRWQISAGLYRTFDSSAGTSIRNSDDTDSTLRRELDFAQLSAEVAWSAFSFGPLDLGAYGGLGVGWGEGLLEEEEIVDERGVDNGRGDEDPPPGAHLFAEAGARAQLQLNKHLIFEGSLGHRWTEFEAPGIGSDTLSGPVIGLALRLHWGVQHRD